MSKLTKAQEKKYKQERKQRTVWRWIRLMSKRPFTYTRSGVVWNINPKKHKPFDVIRFQGKSATEEWDYSMRPDEALDWIYSLCVALEYWFWNSKDYQEWVEQRKKAYNYDKTKIK